MSAPPDVSSSTSCRQRSVWQHRPGSHNGQSHFTLTSFMSFCCSVCDERLIITMQSVADSVTGQSVSRSNWCNLNYCNVTDRHRTRVVFSGLRFYRRVEYSVSTEYFGMRISKHLHMNILKHKTLKCISMCFFQCYGFSTNEQWRYFPRIGRRCCGCGELLEDEQHTTMSPLLPYPSHQLVFVLFYY